MLKKLKLLFKLNKEDLNLIFYMYKVKKEAFTEMQFLLSSLVMFEYSDYFNAALLAPLCSVFVS